MCSLLLIFLVQGEQLHRIFHFFSGFKNGDYKAPSLNFFCFTTLVFHKKYYSEEGPYCAFLANDSLRRNRERYSVYILDSCLLQIASQVFIQSPHYSTLCSWKEASCPYLNQAREPGIEYHVPLEGSLPHLRTSGMGYQHSGFSYFVGPWRISDPNYQGHQNCQISESFLFLFCIPICLLLLYYSNNQALWL